MGEIFKYLKRYSPLFSVQLGKANRTTMHFNKYIWDRYGHLHKFYGPDASYDDIELEIKELLNDKFDAEEYEIVLNPPEEII